VARRRIDRRSYRSGARTTRANRLPAQLAAPLSD